MLLNGVRAVLTRSRVVISRRETDRLAATLAHCWANDADPSSPIGRFVTSGAISDATVDALYDDLVALEQAAEPGSANPRNGEWTPEAVVRTLLEYAAVHRPRGPVPDWKSLRNEQTAATLTGRGEVGRND